jgi:heptosyltransferase III
MQRGNQRNRQLDLWVGTPLLNLIASFRRRRAQPPSGLQHIGVLCSPALGDTLLFSAPLQDLRAALPAAHIVHLCTKQNLAAAEIIPGADKRVLIDLTKPPETIRRIRAQQFDVLLDFTSWQRLTAFYTMLSGAQFTVGFRSQGQHRSRGYDRIVDHTADRHELDNLRALLSESGIVPPTSAAHAPAVVIPDSGPEPLPEERDLVAFHLWASGQNSGLREWPEDRWIELARRLARPETLFVVTGAPSDMPRMTPFVQQMRSAGLRAEPFVSPDGFLSLTRLLRRSRLVVSVNTGVMHLAAIAGAPTVSLNGPTAEHRWGARGRCCANVQPADGSGGYLHLGFEFKGQPTDVIERITVEQVAEACYALTAHCDGVVEEVS